MVGVCETTGDVLPESVVHLWGAADSAARDTSADAVVVLNRLSELGGAPYDGNLAYDEAHTPRRPEQILSRVLVSLGEKKNVRNAIWFVQRSREQLRALRDVVQVRREP